MGARNIVRLLGDALVAGEAFNLESTEALKFLPDADDTGAVNIGDGTTDMDLKVFLGSTSAYAEFNVGDGQVNIEGAELHFGDNDKIELGDAAGGDFTIAFDGTQLEVLPTTDDTGAVNFGDGTTDADVKIFLGSATEHVTFDVGNSKTTITGIPVDFATTGRLQFKVTALTANTTLNSTHFGGIITTRGAGGAIVLTLPAAASNANEWVWVVNVADQNLTLAGAAGELVTFNDAAANSVAFSTASEKIGGGFFAFSDGTSWLIQPSISEAQTITVAT